MQKVYVQSQTKPNLKIQSKVDEGKNTLKGNCTFIKRALRSLSHLRKNIFK